MDTFRTLLTLVCLFVLLTLATCTAPGAARPDLAADSGDIRVVNAWIRPAATAGGNGALYMTLTNVSATADRLLTVETAIAQAAELHETQHDNGVMRMRPLPGGVELAAGQQIEFGPGGKHVMLLNMAAPPPAGQAVDVTLTFEQAGRVELSIVVAEEAP